MSVEVTAKSGDDVCAQSLVQARELVRQLEAGNGDEADRIISELSNIRDTGLYQEIGKLTRELHEKINDFIDDSRLRTLTQEEIPDARDRLSYVIELTEKSTHSTLESVEHAMPVVANMASRAKELKAQWQGFIQNKQGVDIFRTMISDLDEYLQQVIDETGGVHADLSDVLMAQSYQDITGQVIQRVISLVQTVEQSLVGIIQTTSKRMDTESQKAADKDSSGHGPAVPGVTGGDIMNSQDDVDDLLSTLGF